MGNIATVKVFECDGGAFIPIPEEVCDLLGASVGTVFSVEVRPDERALVLTVESDVKDLQTQG